MTETTEIEDLLKSYGWALWDTCKCGGVYHRKYKGLDSSLIIDIIESRNQVILWREKQALKNMKIENLKEILEYVESL